MFNYISIAQLLQAINSTSSTETNSPISDSDVGQETSLSRLDVSSIYTVQNPTTPNDPSQTSRSNSNDAPKENASNHTSPSAERVRKPQRHHIMPGSDNKVVNVINSTKIIIKGINVNAAAAAAAAKAEAEERVTSPLPPQLQPHDVYPEAISAEQKLSNTSNGEDESIENKSTVSEEPIEENSVSAPNTPTIRTSTPKINRECMLLQRTVNESKMLTEYMNDSESRVRKAKRGSGVAQRQVADDASDNESAVSSRGGGSRAADRSRSRSRSRNQSPGSSDGKGPRRSNMRSQNAEFSAKHQKFLMGIQQHHQQESDASENTDHELEGGRSQMLTDAEAGAADGDNTNDVHLAPQVSFDKIFFFKQAIHSYNLLAKGWIGFFLLDLQSRSSDFSVHYMQTFVPPGLFKG